MAPAPTMAMAMTQEEAYITSSSVGAGRATGRRSMDAGRAVSMLHPPSPSSSPAKPSALCLSSNTPFSSRNSLSSRIPPADPPAFLPLMATSDGTLNSSSVAPARTSPSSAIDFLMLCQRLKGNSSRDGAEIFRRNSVAQIRAISRVCSAALSIDTTKRTGWVNHGLKETESIADHMHRMAVMAIIGADIPGIDRDKCVKMAVIHDIAEAIVGDITPSCGVPKEEKSRRERAAIDEMCNLLGGSFAAEEVKSLWLEYENNASLEANIVKDFDKVEMILQALEYETEQGKVLNDFYESTAGKFQTDVGKSWAAEIIARRKNMMDERKQ